MLFRSLRLPSIRWSITQYFSRNGRSRDSRSQSQGFSRISCFVSLKKSWRYVRSIGSNRFREIPWMTPTPVAIIIHPRLQTEGVHLPKYPNFKKKAVCRAKLWPPKANVLVDEITTFPYFPEQNKIHQCKRQTINTGTRIQTWIDII